MASWLVLLATTLEKGEPKEEVGAEVREGLGHGKWGGGGAGAGGKVQMRRILVEVDCLAGSVVGLVQVEDGELAGCGELELLLLVIVWDEKVLEKLVWGRTW